MSETEALETIAHWLNKCNSLKRLNFTRNYLVKYNVRSARKMGYLPISFGKLKDQNEELFTMLN